MCTRGGVCEVIFLQTSHLSDLTHDVIKGDALTTYRVRKSRKPSLTENDYILLLKFIRTISALTVFIKKKNVSNWEIYQNQYILQNQLLPFKTLKRYP